MRLVILTGMISRLHVGLQFLSRSRNTPNGSCMLVCRLAAAKSCRGKKNKDQTFFNRTMHLNFRGPYFPSCSASPTVAPSPPFSGTLMPCRYASLKEGLVVRLLPPCPSASTEFRALLQCLASRIGTCINRGLEVFAEPAAGSRGPMRFRTLLPLSQVLGMSLSTSPMLTWDADML